MISFSRALAESLDRCVDQSDPEVNFLLRSLATYAMVQALYFSTGRISHGARAPWISFVQSLMILMMPRVVVSGSVKPDEWDHYGLALGQYPHFTSPIRRYADVVVHRLLMEAMKKQDWWSDHGDDGGGGGKGAPEEERSVLENGALQELSEHLNDRNKAAQNAQRSSQALFQTLYFKVRLGIGFV